MEASAGASAAGEAAAAGDARRGPGIGEHWGQAGGGWNGRETFSGNYGDGLCPLGVVGGGGSAAHGFPAACSAGSCVN